eukprot:gnl/TRDRNA2_/TRDRNA2_81434_c0_seq1.p1 gnl/TRDRNA2_/TRDRNA2_81434_c0~~gnl/TRDRNA2_/TRDRNA2_81434_c0_seq1.p1  ORF type:complete len:667 (+),score=132.98 gnl/TRDRNA2_/TRDRNA2_81434_c0_seq1:77-2077(+)
MAQANLIIRGGTIVDGTGAKPFVADIAICGREITAVGKDLPMKGDREVDARGLLVAPGWVDPHTHYDAQMLWDPYFSPSTNNGVSTLVIGNCGVGIAPCHPSTREHIIDVCDAVENIPSASIKEAVKFDWETFPEYLQVLEKLPLACDVGVLVGHTSVRYWVMGARANMPDRPGGAEKNPVSRDEIDRMSKVVEEAVAAGAFGFSASRVGLHRDTKGVLMPGSLAHPEEMVALAEGIVRGGGGIFELATEWSLYDDVPRRDPKMVAQYQKNEWKWVHKVATMNENLLFTTGMGSGMTKETARGHRGFLKLMEKINAAGGRMMATPMMRMGMLTFSLSSGWHPLVLSSTFRRLKKESGESMDALVKSMADMTNRAAILAEVMEKKQQTPPHRAIGLYNAVLDSPYMLWPWQADTEPRPEDSLGARAEREGKSVLDLAYDVLIRPDAAHGGILWKALYNYGNGDLEPLREMLENQYVVPGFADGGAHMGAQCEATTPTTMMTHWVRDRTRGEKMPIEMVVRKQTADSARMIGLYDRGELRPGMKADVNLIDFDKLRVMIPEYKNDLPLGAGRWVQDVAGYKMSIVSGTVTYENGKATGALPGSLVRNPRSIGLKGSLKGTVPAAQEVGEVEAVDLSEHALKLASAQGVGMSGVHRAMKGGEETPQSRL